MKTNWIRQMEEDLSENRELGIGDLLSCFCVGFIEGDLTPPMSG